MYLRCPSAKIVSKARDDFPLPLKPVKTINLFRGILRSMFFKLCSLAPKTSINPFSGTVFFFTTFKLF